ncbi:cobalt ABC transporter ATP-binding protein [Actinorhabdospora filicis]|uniref:Cobalt ABC transporter ATP-binding protein n=1 Tax=Actinorhabdospora filicis TaxID=1785913 RepID=A0A9W6SGZ3_9ACTN|nr:cobalt ABC transporter ATP-binding protein [Actinorhabdospora filicis]
MIRFEDVSIAYGTRTVLSHVDFEVPEGELRLLVGPTGTGKSTLLGAVCGLVPHFTGGTFHGTVTVAGRDTRKHRPSELTDVVGYVGQDPLAGFVTESVEEELAYAMESLATPDAIMRKRVAETVDLLGLAELRDRPLSTLSAGQRQRVAIGAALTAQPKVLVLDEPTSALDPGAAEEVLAALHRLVHDLGVTVLLAEHRLERVVQYADTVALLRPGVPGIEVGEPGEVLLDAPVAPPVVRLAKLAGWSPVPVSVRDARRRAASLRSSLPEPPEPSPVEGEPLLSVRDLTVRHPGVTAVNGVGFTVGRGERVAVMGRNGSGKSSMLWALQGTGKRAGGVIEVAGADPSTLDPKRRRRLAGLVPSEPADLLYAETVAAECAQADRESGGNPPVSCWDLLCRFTPGIDPAAHPRDLSEGQRLSLAVAVVLTAAPPVLLLDEPTRGLDYPAKAALATRLRELAEAGSALLVTTHDVEFAAEYATRVIVLSDGEIVADGPAREIVTSSAIFAPQVSKVLAPARYLTVEEVRAGLA